MRRERVASEAEAALVESTPLRLVPVNIPRRSPHSLQRSARLTLASLTGEAKLMAWHPRIIEERSVSTQQRLCNSRWTSHFFRYAFSTRQHRWAIPSRYLGKVRPYC